MSGVQVGEPAGGTDVGVVGPRCVEAHRNPPADHRSPPSLGRHELAPPTQSPPPSNEFVSPSAQPTDPQAMTSIAAGMAQWSSVVRTTNHPFGILEDEPVARVIDAAEQPVARPGDQPAARSSAAEPQNHPE